MRLAAAAVGGVDGRSTPRGLIGEAGQVRIVPLCTYSGRRDKVKMPKYPEIQGGGSLIVAWQVKNKHVLVVGGGEVSSREIPLPASEYIQWINEVRGQD